MKYILRAALPALALLALAGPARAIGWDSLWPYKVEAGANVYVRVNRPQQQQGQLGPWYLYWPLEAHFQSPAPTGYPTYPTPYSLPPGFQAPRPQQMPQFQPPVPTPHPQFQPPVPTPHPQYLPPAPTPMMPPAGNGGR